MNKENRGRKSAAIIRSVVAVITLTTLSSCLIMLTSCADDSAKPKNDINNTSTDSSYQFGSDSNDSMSKAKDNESISDNTSHSLSDDNSAIVNFDNIDSLIYSGRLYSSNGILSQFSSSEGVLLGTIAKTVAESADLTSDFSATALSTGAPLYADSNDILPKTIYAVVGENEAIEYELTPYFVTGDGVDAVLVAWDCMPTIRLGEKDYHPYEELICLSIEDADAERQRIIDSCELIGRIESVIDSVYMPKNSLEANFAGVKDEIYKSGSEYYLVFNSTSESNGRYTYAQKLSIDE